MKRTILLYLFLVLGFKLAAQQDHFLWVRTQGSSSFELGKSVCVDQIGNVYVAGTFEDVVDFDPESTKLNLTSKGYSDVYIVKFDSKGTFIWAKQLGGPRIDHVNSICVDASNNIFVVGSYENSMDADPSSGVYTLNSNGSNEGYVISLNSNGQLRWALSIGGIGYDNVTDAIPTANGNLMISGDFQDSMDVIPGPVTNMIYSSGNSDAYIMKLKNDGSYVWAKSIGGKKADYASKIQLDNLGNILVAGKFRDTVDFDPSFLGFHIMINEPPPFAIPAIIDYNTFVLKLDPNGNFTWSIQYDALTAANEVSGLETDDQRNLFVSGTFSGNTDFDPSIGVDILTHGGFAGYISKLDENGTHIWVKQFKGNGNCALLGMALDTAFNIYTTGQFSYSIFFDPNSNSQELSSIGFNTNPFISKLDKNGNFQWVKHLSGGGSGGSGICIDTQLSVYTCGGWSDTLNFHPDSTLTLYSAGLFDAYLHKMSQCPATVFTEKYLSVCDSFVSENRTYTESGVYSDTIINDLLCDSVYKLYLTVNKVDVEARLNHVSCQETNNGSIQVTGNAVTFTIPEIQVTNSTGLFDHLFPGVYHIISKDSNGCSSEDELNLMQLSCCDKVFLPNAFTPNADGMNDEFRFLNAYGIDLHKFQVYNRWGGLVFNAQNPLDSWDGRFKGGEAEIGTYFYCIQFTCLSNKKEYTLKGDLDLIR